MSVLLQCFGLAGIELNGTGAPSPVGKFLKDFDPDAYGGAGLATWTDDQAQAKQFFSAADAMLEWKRQSTVQPLRADGKPNRPLTAYSVTLASYTDGTTP